LPHPCATQLAHCETCTAPPAFSCSTCFAGYSLISGLCTFCDTFMSNCLSCTSSTHCTDCHPTYYISANSSACFSCAAVPVPNCYDCSSPSVCVTCINDTYYPNITGLCTLCGVEIPNCYRCNVNAGASQFNCIECDLYYFLNSTVCQSCSSINPLCIECLNLYTCTLCSTGYCAHGTFCTSCHIHIPNCD
jgi:hypothetical protein